MSKINYVQMHIGDFLTGVLHMSAEETGAYIMLIMAHYQAGEKGLPNDDKKLSRIAKVTPRKWSVIKETVLEKFTLKNDFYTQKRVVNELKRVQEVSQRQSAKALKKHNTDDATAKPRHSQPITNNQEPIYTVDVNARENENSTDAKNASVQLGKEISKITGWDKDPNWFGDYSRIQLWIERGWCPDRDIIPTVKKLTAKKTGPPPKSLKYFEQAIADAHEQRKQPLPEGQVHEPKPDRKQKYTSEDALADFLRERGLEACTDRNDDAAVLCNAETLRQDSQRIEGSDGRTSRGFEALPSPDD